MYLLWFEEVFEQVPAKIVFLTDGLPTAGEIDSRLHAERSSRLLRANLDDLPDGVFVLDCGNTPENYLQPVADKMPSRILIIDCCNYGAKPGESRLFSRDEIEQLSYGLLSTHTLPLTLRQAWGRLLSKVTASPAFRIYVSPATDTSRLPRRTMPHSSSLSCE